MINEKFEKPSRPETKEDAIAFVDTVKKSPSNMQYSRDNDMSETTVRRWLDHCKRLIDSNINLPDGMFAKGISYLEDVTTGEQKKMG